MFKRIKKRDGKIVKFDAEKITRAISAAGKETGEISDKIAARLTLKVLSLAEETIKEKTPSVEQIQDIVEEVLLGSAHKETAKAYVIYREQHAQLRSFATKANIDLVENYLKKADWKVKENSNMSFSLQGLNNYISSEIISEYWLNQIYSPKIRELHKSGDFHLHDLGFLSTYCVGWDLADLLREGFRGVEGKIECKPPKHFKTALGQMVNFFYTMQGESAGAQAFSSFDTYLAPFIAYDKLTYPEVKQAMQEFLFNMNVPTRVGFQTPFTNITLDLEAPKIMAEEPVIIGGKIKEKTYDEFQQEMDLLNRAFAEVMLEGDAKGRVFSFPIPTYNITKDFDWSNKKLEPVWKMTARYGIPYFANFVNSDMKPDDVRSMCCRLRIDNRKLMKRGGGLFGAHPLTGSVGVVTLNMPRLGYLAKDEKDFFKRLDDLVEAARKSLQVKRKVLERFTENGLYPYSKFYLRNVKKRFGSFWKNHFSTIGLIGLNEAVMNLLRKNLADEAGRKFGTKVLDHLRDKIQVMQEEDKVMYNLEATPGEGTSYRLALLDKARYPKIIAANEPEVKEHNADPYYTNSSHLPVNYSDDVFEVLDLQDNLQTRYTGGTVLHIFTGEKLTDAEAVKNLVRKISKNYHLPYFSITPTFSICPTHGYFAGENHRCPVCRAATEVYSRVVGYLRPVKQWNKGKQAEFKNRRTYKLLKKETLSKLKVS